MPNEIFAFMVLIVALASILFNARFKDSLRRVIILISFFLAIIVTWGVYLVIKGVIK